MPAVECGFGNGAGDSGSRRLVEEGPTLQVQVSRAAEDWGNAPAGGDLPAAAAAALVDTGASGCCVDVDLAERLGLAIVDRRTVSGIGGTVEVSIYRVQLRVPELNLLITDSMPGVYLAAGRQPHRVLIGRDFLRYFTMVYAGRAGSVKISSATGGRSFWRGGWLRLWGGG